MGLKTEALLDVRRKQIEAQGTLVWYDPEAVYQDLAASLAQEQVAGASGSATRLNVAFSGSAAG